MKKILHINSQFEIIGGMERYIESFYISMKNQYEIKILKLNKGINNSFIESGNIYSFEEKIENNIKGKIKLILLLISNKISFICKKEKIDISISHGEICNILNVFSKIFGNKSEIILIIHSTISKETVGPIIYYMAKLFYKYADKIICVSKELEKDIQKELNIKGNKITNIYNPFDFVKIEKLKDEKIENNIKKIINKNNINFCHIARLEKYKKQDLLLEYFSEYRKLYNKNCNLFLIGDGNYKKSLEKKARELKNENNIFFLGFKDNIYKYINQMDFFLYLSGLQEGFGRTLIDSLSLGTPVLTHDYKYGAKEIIRNNNDLSDCKNIEIHENGILTPYMNKEKFIKAMDLITKTKFDKEKIKHNIEKYNIENFSEKWNLILK